MTELPKKMKKSVSERRKYIT